MSRICLVYLSRICPDRICPVFSAHKKFWTINLTILPDIFQIFSEPHEQILDIFDDIFNLKTIPLRKKRITKKKHALAESIKQNTKNGEQ
jgi:hypothetical protein